MTEVAAVRGEIVRVEIVKRDADGRVRETLVLDSDGAVVERIVTGFVAPIVESKVWL